MALSFANTAGNLFNRLGRFGKLAHIARTFQTDLKTYHDQLMAQYDSAVASPLQIAADGVATLRDQTRQEAASFMDALSVNAETTVMEMVKADKPTAAGSLTEALLEIRRQMLAAVATIKSCTVAASTAAASTNQGTGVLVASTKRGDGLTQELLYPEVAYVRCVGDSQTGGATTGLESFQYQAPVAAQSPWAFDFPLNSGLITSLTAISGAEDPAEGGNVIPNGDMEDFTSNLPDDWTQVVGTAGIDFQQSTTEFYDGAKSLQYVGGATLTSLYASLDTSLLDPLTSYAVNFRAKVDVVPAAGVLTVELVDSSNTVINDDQGVANSFTVTLSGLTTSWASQTGVFRMPRLIPSAVRFRVRISTGLSAGSNLFMDRFASGAMTQAYPGGPGLAAFSGATKFVLDDYFTLTTTNDYGGASNLSTFHWLLDRLFNLRSLGVLLPTTGAPSVGDALITA